LAQFCCFPVSRSRLRRKSASACTLSRETLARGFFVFLPFYIYVYARRHKVGVWLMRLWYLGIAVFLVGATLAS